MDDYNKYVTSVNKIYDFLEKMKIGWNNNDNKNYIETIDEFKNTVISKADEFKKPPTVQLEKTSAELLEEQTKDEEERNRQNSYTQQNSSIPEEVTHSDNYVNEEKRDPEKVFTPKDTVDLVQPKGNLSKEFLMSLEKKVDIPDPGSVDRKLDGR